MKFTYQSSKKLNAMLPKTKLKDKATTNPMVILIADDDPDDVLLAKDALSECVIKQCVIETVANGEELLEYLRGKRGFFGSREVVRPALILLDLNMPKKGGKESLQEIKTNPNLRDIPVVVLSTSEQQEDIVSSYQLGANSFISKPVFFEEWVEVMKAVSQYWLQVVSLPCQVCD